jgi:large subunit ribosomal protein L35Ae
MNKPIKINKTHKNKYENFSGTNRLVGSSENKEESNHDYFKIEFYNTAAISIKPENIESSIERFKYFVKDDFYILKLRDCDRITRMSSLDDFFDLTYMGAIEKGELRAIKKIIEPLIKKLRN